MAACFAHRIDMPDCELTVLGDMNMTVAGVLKNLASSQGKVRRLEWACGGSCEEDGGNGDSGPTLQAFMRLRRRRDKPGLLIPTSDLDLLFLSEYRAALSERFTLSLPDEGTLRYALDKERFHRDLRRAGIPTPETRAVDGADAENASARGGRFPCILKPAFSGDWKRKRAERVLGGRKAVVVRGAEELDETRGRLAAVSRHLIRQEIVPQLGEDNFSYCGYADGAGRVCWGFVTQKLIQYPEQFGTALLCRTVDRPEVASFGERVIRTLGIEGIFELEIIRNAVDRDLYVIELNTRHWSQHRLSTLLGVNITLLDVYARTGDRKRFESTLRSGNRAVRAIWIDDVGYPIYAVHHLANPGKAFVKELWNKKIEASLCSTLGLPAYVRAVASKMGERAPSPPPGPGERSCGR
jgi:predicted ATP-grasp superfamily ATP-dependent carboligase